MKKLSILLVLTILAIITSCTGSEVLDKSNIDSAIMRKMGEICLL